MWDAFNRISPPTLNNRNLNFAFTSKALQFCGAYGLFKDPVSLHNYFRSAVEFYNRFWSRAQMAVAGGNPWWLLESKNPLKARRAALMWANGYRKDLTASWHAIGCRNLRLPV